MLKRLENKEKRQKGQQSKQKSVVLFAAILLFYLLTFVTLQVLPKINIKNET